MGNNAIRYEKQKAIEELQIYQEELETQNEELLSRSLEIRRERERFASLFEAAPLGYLAIDRKGVIADLNKRALEIFDHPKPNMLGKPLAAFIASANLNKFYAFLDEVNYCEDHVTCEMDFTIPDRNAFQGRMYGVSYCAPGSIPEIFLTITDNSAQQPNALKAAKLKLDLALEASLTGICELRQTSGELHLDRFCCSLFGILKSSHTVALHSLLPRVHPYDRQLFEEKFRSASGSAGPLEFEFRTAGKESEIKYIQVRGRLVSETGDKHKFLATFTDISERKRWEIENQRLATEQDKALLKAALKAGENEKKRISEALHDGVAQILWAVKIKLHSLRTDTGTKNFEQVNELVEQAITDTRNLSFQLTPVILKDFGLKAAIEEMAARLKDKDLSFKIKVNVVEGIASDALLSVYRITQELVNNCIKHAGCDQILIEISSKNHFLIIRVEDNGAGIEKALLKKPKGTGLSSIRNRIKLYDGKMEVQSNDPKGTRISITLKHTLAEPDH